MRSVGRQPAGRHAAAAGRVQGVAHRACQDAQARGQGRGRVGRQRAGRHVGRQRAGPKCGAVPKRRAKTARRSRAVPSQRGCAPCHDGLGFRKKGGSLVLSAHPPYEAKQMMNMDRSVITLCKDQGGTGVASDQSKQF